mgnify:CR=1 FL=1
MLKDLKSYFISEKELNNFMLSEGFKKDNSEEYHSQFVYYNNNTTVVINYELEDDIYFILDNSFYYCNNGICFNLFE